MPPPPTDKILPMLNDGLAKILSAGIRPVIDGNYRHWDTMRQLTPPAGLTHEEWWLGTKLARGPLMHSLPLLGPDDRPFRYSTPDPAQAMLHDIDKRAGGRIGMPEVVTNPATRSQYLVTSLIEEAITSSQLEGATTSRKVAKEMLRSGRNPSTKSERMIFNNYAAMNTVREWVELPFTPERVLQLQRIVTEGTLDNPDAAGRLQRPDEERVAVYDRQTQQLLHRPPPAEILPQRLDLMCEFANGKDTEGFLHPVARAVILHLWLAYDHPFEDGNGRTARALFYWSMLRSGYWLTEFLSISRILAKAPGQYGRAFLFTETDELDATYFLLYQLRVIVRAIDDLDRFLELKGRELKETRALLRRVSLNHRQLDLMNHAIRHPDADYTFKGHMAAHDVVYQSARTDLLDLVTRGYLERGKVGQTTHFWPVENLPARLADGRRAGS